MESDGEDELLEEDEEFDEDAIAGGSVSQLQYTCRMVKLTGRKLRHRLKDAQTR